MANELVAGALAVEVYAKRDRLNEDLRKAEQDVKTKKEKIERDYANIKATMDDRLLKLKISDVQKLHATLKKRLEEKIRMDFDVASINRTKAQIKSVEETLDKINLKTKTSNSLFGNFGIGKAAGLIGGFIAAGEIFQFAQKAKDAARDAEEIKSKFEQVFSSIRDEADKTANEFSESFKLAESTTKELLSGTGDILVGFGFDEKTALELSNRVNSLAIDLASFSNYSGGAVGASRALTSAMLGETEAAKSLGIVLRQGTPEFNSQMKAVMDSQKVNENQARALILLEEAYKQSSKAVGDFSRTQESAANQERIFAEIQKTITENIGAETIPAYKAVLSYLTSLLTEMSNGQGTLSAFGFLVKGIATGLLSVGYAIETVIRGAFGLGRALGALISLNFSDIPKEISNAWEGYVKSHESTSKIVREVWSNDLGKGSSEAAKQIKNNLNNILSNNQKAVVDINKVWKEYYDTMKFEAEEYYKYRKGIIEKDVSEFLKATGDQIKAEEFKVKKLKQLGDEFFAWLKTNYGVGFSDAIRLAGNKEIFGKYGQTKNYIPEQLTEKKKPENSNPELEEQVSLWERIVNAERDAFENLSSFWSAQVSLFKNANSMLEQFLDTLIQVALQEAAMFAIGSFSGGGILGGIAKIFGFSKGGIVTNFGNGNIQIEPHQKFSSGVSNFIVPSGFNKDNYLIGVQSGEKVSVSPAGSISKNNNELNSANLNYQLNIQNNNLISAIDKLIRITASKELRSDIKNDAIVVSYERGNRQKRRLS